MSGYATIPVRKDTKELLKSYGSKGETYDALIKKLIAIADHAQIMETHYQRLGDKNDFVPFEEL